MLTSDNLNRIHERARLTQAHQVTASALNASHPSLPRTAAPSAHRVPTVRVDVPPYFAMTTFTAVQRDNKCRITALDACITDKLGKLSEDNPKILLEKTLIELASTTDDRVRVSSLYDLFALTDACFQNPEKSIELRLPVMLQNIATEVLKELVNLLSFRTAHADLFIQRADANQEKLLASIFLYVHMELMTRYALQLQRQEQIV